MCSRNKPLFCANYRRKYEIFQPVNIRVLPQISSSFILHVTFPLPFNIFRRKWEGGIRVLYCIYILASRTTYCHLSPWIPHILYYSSFEQGGKSHRFLVRFIAILQLGSKSGLILSKFRRRKNVHSFWQSRQIISVQKRKQLKVFKMQNFLKLGLFHVAVGEISVLYNTVVNSGRYLIHCILYRYVNSKSITRLSRSANDCIAYWRLKFFFVKFRVMLILFSSGFQIELWHQRWLIFQNNSSKDSHCSGVCLADS